MYIFFASTGAVSNIVIDDEELRQGNVNVNNVYAYFASRPNISYTGTVTFERSDGLLSPERTMTPMTFVYETVSYAGYHFLIDDPWILATYGELKSTVRLRSGAGAVLASGLITANVEQTIYEDEPDITITQYNDLTADIADKAYKSQTVIHVATFDDIPDLDGGVYANWLFILDDGSLYRVDTDTATLIGIIGKNVNYVKSSEILVKGDVIQLSVSTGGFVLVKKAISSEINVYPQLILGIAMQAFTANGFGLILLQGYLSGINTSSGTDGAYVYADTGSASNGLWTVTRPTAPNAIVILGTISNASANGSIDVRITPLPFSEQVNHKTVPTNYTAPTQTVKDNLIGIDTKLGVIDARTLAGTLLSSNITASQLTALINEATTSLKGLMSATDKTNLNTLVALLANNDGDSVINTVTEILSIFSTYPEGVNIVTALATKVESTDTTFTDGLVIVQDGAVSKKHKQSAIASAKLTTTDDTSAVDATIVVQDSTTGKKYKKSSTLISDLATNVNLALKSDMIFGTNLLVNGDMTTLSNWTAGGGTGAVASNVYSLTGNGSSTLTYISQGITSGIVSAHKMYARMMARVTNSLCTQLRVRVVATSATDVAVLNPVINTWYTFSQIITASATGSGSFVPTAVYANTTDATGAVMEVKYCEFMDLTASFVAGNEPTVAQIEALLTAKFANAHFNGTAGIFNLNDMFQLYSTKELLNVPTSYQLVVGDTFELFYKGIVNNVDYKEYLTEIVSTVGKRYKRKYVYTPSAGDVGTKTLTINLYDKKHILQQTKTVSLIVKAKATNPATTKNVLCIGDSLTAGSQYVTELRNRLVTVDGLSNLAFVGTKGTAPNQHEGVSGWNITNFLGTSSPFYNSGTGLIDFANYCTVNSIASLDYVYILLGWNTFATYIADTANSLTTYLSQLKTLGDYIVAAFPSCKISFIGIEFPDEDGVGESYGASSTFTMYNLVKYMFTLNDLLPTASAYYTGGTFVQLSGQFDTEFNMPSTAYAANVRNATTELRGTNGIHPDTTGYLQIADAVYRDLNNKL